MRRNTSKLLGAVVGVSLYGILLAGCGGGGGGNATPAPDTRAAAIDTVKATRQLSDVFAMNSAGSGEENVLRGRATRAALKHAKATRAETIPDGEGFDEDEGLYYRFQQTEQGFKVVYHRDPARTQPAGYIELSMPDDTTVYFVFRMDAGREPVWGDLILRYDNANTSSGRLTGWIQDPRTEERVTFDLHVEENETASGSVTVRTGGNTLALTDIARSASGRLQADLAFAGRTGSITQEADGSGVLTVNEVAGALTARYDADGKGTITLPNGQQVQIADFDAEL
jgi:hypothetical protein